MKRTLLPISESTSNNSPSHRQNVKAHQSSTSKHHPSNILHQSSIASQLSSIISSSTSTSLQPTGVKHTKRLSQQQLQPLRSIPSSEQMATSESTLSVTNSTQVDYFKNIKDGRRRNNKLTQNPLHSFFDNSKNIESNEFTRNANSTRSSMNSFFQQTMFSTTTATTGFVSPHSTNNKLSSYSSKTHNSSMHREKQQQVKVKVTSQQEHQHLFLDKQQQQQQNHPFLSESLLDDPLSPVENNNSNNHHSKQLRLIDDFKNQQQKTTPFFYPQQGSLRKQQGNNNINSSSSRFSMQIDSSEAGSPTTSNNMHRKTLQRNLILSKSLFNEPKQFLSTMSPIASKATNAIPSKATQFHTTATQSFFPRQNIQLRSSQSFAKNSSMQSFTRSDKIPIYRQTMIDDLKQLSIQSADRLKIEIDFSPQYVRANPASSVPSIANDSNPNNNTNNNNNNTNNTNNNVNNNLIQQQNINNQQPIQAPIQQQQQQQQQQVPQQPRVKESTSSQNMMQEKQKLKGFIECARGMVSKASAVIELIASEKSIMRDIYTKLIDLQQDAASTSNASICLSTKYIHAILASICGDKDISIKLWKEFLRMCNAYNLFSWKMTAYKHLARLYLERTEYARSLVYLKKLLKYSWLYDSENLENYAYEQISRAYYHQNEIDLTIYFYDRAIHSTFEPFDSPIREMGVRITKYEIAKKVKMGLDLSCSEDEFDLEGFKSAEVLNQKFQALKERNPQAKLTSPFEAANPSSLATMTASPTVPAAGISTQSGGSLGTQSLLEQEEQFDESQQTELYLKNATRKYRLDKFKLDAKITSTVSMKALATLKNKICEPLGPILPKNKYRTNAFVNLHGRVNYTTVQQDVVPRFIVYDNLNKLKALDKIYINHLSGSRRVEQLMNLSNKQEDEELVSNDCVRMKMVTPTMDRLIQTYIRNLIDFQNAANNKIKSFSAASNS